MFAILNVLKFKDIFEKKIVGYAFILEYVNILMQWQNGYM